MINDAWDPRYDDILYLPHPVSWEHPCMPRRERAAQFASFKALTGFEDEIGERGRYTEAAGELDERYKEELNARLQLLLEGGAGQPEAEFVWFEPDEKKEGGRYCRARGSLRRIDMPGSALYLQGGERIPLERLYDIRWESLAEE